MRRREYLAATGGAVATAAFTGCVGDGTGNGNGDGGSETGTLATRVTDQPGDIDDFESCVVTITEIRLKPAEDEADDEDDEDADVDGEGTATPEATATDAESTETDSAGTETESGEDDSDDEDDAEDEGEVVYELDDAQADLVELQDGNTKLIDDREVETGEYEYMKLTVTEVDATLEGGGDTDVETPGNAPLKFNAAFEIRADTRTVFTADFTPVKRGQQNSYILQPVADGVEVSYEEVGTADGDGTAEPTDTPTEA